MGDVSLENQQGPYIDGELIPALPKDLLREGRYRHAPILVGSNLRESCFLESDFFRSQNRWPLVSDGIALSIGLLALYPQDFAAILEHYGAPADDADANRIMVEVMDDSWMKCPGRRLAQGAVAHDDPVYVYSFDLAPAVHTLELDYVFGDPAAPFSRLFPGAPVPPDPALVMRVQDYWLRFARTGDPNGGAGPAWPRYSAASDEHLVLDRSTTTGTGLDKAECDFWLTTYAGGR
jgi:para-nitrobenzyl esterase